MPYDANCCSCPYHDQRHLPDDEKTQRADPPVDLENNRSGMLIVAQAPGWEEWRSGSPLLATKKKGGTAGARIEQSLRRVGKTRKDFDIVEAIQCYPGRGERQRDKEPDRDAIRACTYRLRQHLVKGNYRKAIALGEIAYEALRRASKGLCVIIEHGGHPTGGTSSKCLDRLWCDCRTQWRG